MTSVMSGNISYLQTLKLDKLSEAKSAPAHNTSVEWAAEGGKPSTRGEAGKSGVKAYKT